MGVEEKKPDEVQQKMEVKETDQEIEEMPDDLKDPVMWETETGKFLSDLLSVFLFEAHLSNAIFINCVIQINIINFNFHCVSKLRHKTAHSNNSH